MLQPLKFKATYSGLTHEKGDTASLESAFVLDEVPEKWDTQTGERINLVCQLNDVADEYATSDPKVKVSIYYKDNNETINVPTEFAEFIDDELKRQIELPRSPSLNARPGMGTTPAFEHGDQLWDLRIRFSDFLWRFVNYYDLRPTEGPESDTTGRKVLQADPFLVFFLFSRSRSTHIAHRGRHIRSGLLGHCYCLDPGQIQYLNEEKKRNGDGSHNLEEIQSGYLPFPEGLCGKVYLTGRPVDPESVKDITVVYESATSRKLAEPEQQILKDKYLLEIPVYDATSDMEGMPDGPELILCVAVPSAKEGDKPKATIGSGQLFEEVLKAPKGSCFVPGEAQIVTEMGQWLAARYLTLPPMMRANEYEFVGVSEWAKKDA